MKTNLIKTSSLFLLLLFLHSCASTEFQAEDPVKKLIKNKSYKSDKISMSTSLMLARSAYLKGCTDQAVALLKNKERKGIYKICLKKADRYIKEEVLSILDQS